MTRSSAWRILWARILALLALSGTASHGVVAQDLPLRIVVQTETLPGQAYPGIEVAGLGAEDRERIAACYHPPTEPPCMLELFVSGQSTAILGKQLFDGERLVFAPRFPLEPDMSFLARFHIQKLRERPGGEPLEWRFRTGLPERTLPAAGLIAAYPTADPLPQNVLRMYLKFATPMARGRADAFVSFVDEEEREIPEAWIRIAQELWSPDGTRLTILFDPGRIKRGLARHDELGAPFRIDQTVTLVVRPGWPDASGQRIEHEFRKSFRVAAPLRSQPSLTDWKLEIPASQTRKPLQVQFDRPFDFAQLQHVFTIVDDSGAALSGEVAIADGERSWSFVPDTPWRGGMYTLIVDPRLEDCAGNSLSKPFEIDITGGVDVPKAAPVTRRTFNIR